MQAAIKAIDYFLPSGVLTNTQLAEEFPDWTPEKIEEKVGIRERHIARIDECSSDLGMAAAQKLFDAGLLNPDDVDYILFCTQTPDYFLPATACLLQDRLRIPSTAGALDLNLGCSGFIYGIGLAKGLVETGQARNVLLITADTYSKLLNPDDRSVRALFGDAAAATLVGLADDPIEAPSPLIGPFVFGTDGRGAPNLIVRGGGMRAMASASSSSRSKGDTVQTSVRLHMNGPELFTFALRVVPPLVAELLQRAGLNMGDVDLFVFHQANQYMLDHLRRKIGIPKDKFYMAMRHCGNTVSSTIPIALREALQEGKLRPGHLVLLVGFGVGYSWGGALVRWVTQWHRQHGTAADRPAR